MRGRGSALLAMGTVAALAAAAVAYAATQIPVRTAGGSELAPTATADYLVWTQNTLTRPNHFDTYARFGSEPRFKVNASGTQGFRGAVTGSKLVYQQVTDAGSDLELFNLVTGQRSAPPTGVNTTRWEWFPSASGDWILFGRVGRLSQSVLLFNLTTHALRRLALLEGEGYLLPGQVNGSYAVWSKCAPLCNVFRFNLATGKTVRVPNPFSKHQYAPSVAADGTVYFARSGSSCGASVRLVRRTAAGETSVRISFESGIDLSSTFVLDEPGGGVSVFYDKGRCRNGAVPNQDIYKIIEP